MRLEAQPGWLIGGPQLTGEGKAPLAEWVFAVHTLAASPFPSPYTDDVPGSVFISIYGLAIRRCSRSSLAVNDPCVK